MAPLLRVLAAGPAAAVPACRHKGQLGPPRRPGLHFRKQTEEPKRIFVPDWWAGWPADCRHGWHVSGLSLAPRWSVSHMVEEALCYLDTSSRGPTGHMDFEDAWNRRRCGSFPDEITTQEEGPRSQCWFYPSFHRSSDFHPSIPPWRTTTKGRKGTKLTILPALGAALDPPTLTMHDGSKEFAMRALMRRPTTRSSGIFPSIGPHRRGRWIRANTK